MTCIVSGCEMPKRTYNPYCHKHYSRVRRTGDPMKRIRGGYGDTPQARFWSKAAVTSNDDRCWNWQQSTNNQGYGDVTADGVRWLAHRYAFFLTYGVEPGEALLHDCDNPRCVNPKHLKDGTKKANSEDMVNKERNRRGENVWNARLTNSQVQTLRQRVASGEKKSHLADEYGIARPTLTSIIQRRSYKYVE